MAFTPTTNLSLPLIDTGTESGTWGELVDNGLTSYLDIAIAGGLAVSIAGSGTTVTLANTAGTSAATNIVSTGATGSTAQYAILNLNGFMTGACTLVLPSSSKSYMINNDCTGGFPVTVKGAATTGVTLRNQESALVAWNGSDYVKVSAGASTSGTITTVGTNAMGLATASASRSTAIGWGALANITSSSNNTAIGAEASYTAVSGTNNTAVGYSALWTNASSSNCVAVGSGALYGTTGQRNIGIGANAGNVLTTGIENIIIGYQTMYAGAGATGSSNVAIGNKAMNTSTSAASNVAVGYSALLVATSGAGNTVVGAQAGSGITTGGGNVIVGGFTAAGVSAPAFSITTQNNYISMGSTSVTNAYIQVAWTVVSDARDKTDFADVPHGLDFVSKLQPTAYRYKENRDATEGHGPVRYGFKAQDVLVLEGDAPVIVDAGNPDKLYFNDQALLAVLVNAINELKAEFDAYKATHP